VEIDIAGRPKIRRENDVKEVARIVKMSNLTKCIQDRVKWREAFEKAKTFKQ
jgi:hypothetical protein